MKVCFKCRTAKPEDAFYKHPMMADGRLGKCKECAKKDSSKNRWAKIEQHRQYDRQRASQPHRVALRARVQKEWRERHPHRRYAQNVLAAAIKSGKIAPLPCMICGEKAEAHHTHYDAPLEVVWLCSPHHKQAHALAKAA